MKKLLVVLMILALPALAFADFQLGGTAMYKGMLQDIQSGTTPGIDDFTFGAEARLKLGIFQGAAAVLYYGDEFYPSLVALTDVGLSLDVLFLRIGVGIGPNFYIPLEDGGPTGLPVGLNLKGSVDFQLGSISLGLVGYYYLASFEDLNADLFQNAQPWIGLTALFKLF